MNNHLTILDANTFAQRLKSERTKRDMQQKDMAKMLNLKRSSLSYYENGYAVPSLDKVYEIAEFFHVPIDYLVGRDELSANTLCTVGDVARILLRLCQFDCVSLQTNSDGKLYLSLDSAVLSDVLKNTIEIAESLNIRGDADEKVEKMKSEHLRISLLALDSIELSATKTRDSVKAE